MRNKFQILFILLGLIQSIQAQDIDVMVATLDGKCCGKISTDQLIKNPIIQVFTEADITFEIKLVKMYSNSTGKFYQFNTNKPELNQEMINHIAGLKNGTHIYFDVIISDSRGKEILLNPLEFEILNNPKNAIPCSKVTSASIKGIVHGKMTKEELLKEGKLTIHKGNSSVKVKSFNYRFISNGKNKKITCYTLKFNQNIISQIRKEKKYRRLYFSNILAIVDNKLVYLNPIEIQLD